MPSLSVVHTVPSKRRNEAPALSSPPNPTEPSSSPGTNHLKPTGTSQRRRPQRGGDAVDHRARDERLADRGIRAPAGSVAEEVLDRDREVVVRVHEAAVGGDDAVPVGVGVVAGEDVEVAGVREHRGHRGGDRRIHADLAVPVERHERPRRVDRGFTTVRSRS